MHVSVLLTSPHRVIAYSSDGADLFDVVDTDGSGMITMNELRAFMRREHPSSTEEQCRNLFNLMDTNHDKSVSRREFERFRSQHPVLITFSLEKLVKFFPCEVFPSRTKRKRKRYLSHTHIHKESYLSSSLIPVCLVLLSISLAPFFSYSLPPPVFPPLSCSLHTHKRMHRMSSSLCFTVWNRIEGIFTSRSWARAIAFMSVTLTCVYVGVHACECFADISTSCDRV